MLDMSTEAMVSIWFRLDVNWPRNKLSHICVKWKKGYLSLAWVELGKSDEKLVQRHVQCYQLQPLDQEGTHHVQPVQVVDQPLFNLTPILPNFAPFCFNPITQLTLT